MKDRLDFSVVRALLRKHRIERRFSFRKGHFDIIGFLLRLVLAAIFVSVFIIFFGRFLGIYVTIPLTETVNAEQRLYEMLVIGYMFILVLMTISGVTAITRELFLADDVKIFSAMPVGAKTLFVAKLLSIYRSQLVFAFATVLTVNISAALTVPQTTWFYVFTIVLCFILPFISIAIASIFALPFYAIRQYLKPRFALMFIVVTVLTGVGVWLYSLVLGAVKQLLLGDDIRYFFNEAVMQGIHNAVEYLFPTNWLASFALKHELLVSGLNILLLVAVCILISMLIIRSILTRVLQARMSGDENFMYPKRSMAPQGSTFSALVKKEFVQIFRTPSYMFSYFSIALLMPLMVYFCIEVGSSLVEQTVGLNCDLELAIFLTLLFSALTNVFCSTNISREGMMFYSLKAQPISHRKIFSAKIFFCMLVTVLSQLISAALLTATGYTSVLVALFIFAVGVVFSFGQICFATRYDFNHARFSTEEDGEIKESGGTVSSIIVLGMVVAFLIGGVVLIIRMLLALRLNNVAPALGYLTYVLVSIITLVFALLSYLYLVRNLKTKYYEFSGGGLF